MFFLSFEVVFFPSLAWLFLIAVANAKRLVVFFPGDKIGWSFEQIVLGNLGNDLIEYCIFLKTVR